MTINVHSSPSEGRIDVLGEFQQSGDHREVCAAIEQVSISTPKVEVTFYDAVTLHREVIEVLASLIKSGKALKIHTYHAYLTHVLLSLNLPANFVAPHDPEKEIDNLQAIVVGGSADSLDKILYLVENLPKSEVPVFIVQHIGEDAQHKLDELLKVRTNYQVLMPQHMQPLEKGTIYIAPPAHHMKVANGLLYLTRDAQVNFARPSIDVLFESLGREYGKGLLGILLCGMSQDGVAGARQMLEAGATVLVEESNECSAPFLTDHARQEGAFDYIMGIQEITSYVMALMTGSDEEISELLLDHFLTLINARYGYDYHGYQYSTVRRRINKLMNILNISSFHSFQRHIMADPGVFQHFYLEMSVEVTSFFRYPEQFQRLREDILPYLDSFPQLKIWSAGCASGEEAYSLAIVLDEAGLLEKSKIFATDINHFAIERAKTGLFPLHDLKETQKNYKLSGGTRSFDDYVEDNELYLKLPERLRKHILFYQHSLVHDGVFNEFQLIYCRNVLIYFKTEQQEQVMERFARSLHPDGFLVLGKSEGLSTGQGERYFKPYDKEERLYRFK